LGKKLFFLGVIMEFVCVMAGFEEFWKWINYFLYERIGNEFGKVIF